MSRSSPSGFAFSILFEIAAVVVIVSFLPRVDLRPLASAVAGQGPSQPSFHANPPVDLAVSPVGWTTPSIRREPAGHETSYYERRAANNGTRPTNPPAGSFPVQPAPPLIELEQQRADVAPRAEVSQRPEYVEQRLDRASQQLVNSVGTAVTSAAENWLRPPPTTEPGFRRQPTVLTPTQPQPRPWIRY
jgi:hypothetical protein